MNLKRIKKTVKELDPSLKETDDSFKIAVILLSGLEQPHRIKDISEFTGYEYQFCRKTIHNIKKAGIWKGKITYHGGWDDEKSGGIAFWCDVATAQGYLTRG